MAALPNAASSVGVPVREPGTRPNQTITFVLRPKWFLKWPCCNKPYLRNRNARRRVEFISHLLPRGDSQTTRREQELLDKQLWGVSSRSPQDGVIILIIVAVFLVGLSIGDIVSATKQASTHAVALITYPNAQE